MSHGTMYRSTSQTTIYSSSYITYIHIADYELGKRTVM